MLKEPKSMDEVVYFTNRMLGAKGAVKAWVFKEICPKCKNAAMGKPKDEKGKVKIRAKEYVCQSCKYSIEQKEYEDTLTANIVYTCPECSFKGEIQIPFKRKKVKIFDEEEQKEKTADALQFECEKCKEKINITKKMK